jgi:hypothetical protein
MGYADVVSADRQEFDRLLPCPQSQATPDWNGCGERRDQRDF